MTTGNPVPWVTIYVTEIRGTEVTNRNDNVKRWNVVAMRAHIEEERRQKYGHDEGGEEEADN